MKKHTILISLMMLFLITFLVSCGEKAVITGTVDDGFGEPLNDVVIKVEGTTFEAKTNAHGKYNVGYVPGKIKVVYQKQGYTSKMLTPEIATESRYPAETITMYKIPEKTGLYLFSNNTYLPINSVFISSRESSVKSSLFGPTLNDYFAIGKPTIVSVSTDSEILKFLDYIPFSTDILAVKPDGYIGRHGRLIFGSEKLKYGVGSGMTVREMMALPGTYIFVDVSKSWWDSGLFVSSKNGFYFEIRKENKK